MSMATSALLSLAPRAASEVQPDQGADLADLRPGSGLGSACRGRDSHRPDALGALDLDTVGPLAEVRAPWTNQRWTIFDAIELLLSDPARSAEVAGARRNTSASPTYLRDCIGRS